MVRASLEPSAVRSSRFRLRPLGRSPTVVGRGRRDRPPRGPDLRGLQPVGRPRPRGDGGARGTVAGLRGRAGGLGGRLIVRRAAGTRVGRRGGVSSRYRLAHGFSLRPRAQPGRPLSGADPSRRGTAGPRADRTAVTCQRSSGPDAGQRGLRDQGTFERNEDSGLPGGRMQAPQDPTPGEVALRSSGRLCRPGPEESGSGRVVSCWTIRW